MQKVRQSVAVDGGANLTSDMLCGFECTFLRFRVICRRKMYKCYPQ